MPEDNRLPNYWPQSVRSIDWAELREYKQALLSFQGEDWAEGLLCLIDHIQDEAAKILGTEAVFKAMKGD